MEKIKAYFMRISEDGIPYKGYPGEIENTLKAKQKYVGGTIQAVRLTDEIDVVCNDEGKIRKFPKNRIWFLYGEPVDILCGNILCVRHDMEGNFTSIREEDIPVVQKHLKVFSRDGKILQSDEGCPEWGKFMDIDKYREKYPEGTVLRLTADLDDPYRPKKAGETCVVKCVDDAGNIHVHWDSGGSVALIIWTDYFKKL